MAKAIKLYSVINGYQLAKRADGNWFYRTWGNHGYGPSWSKWLNIGKLRKTERRKNKFLLLKGRHITTDMDSMMYDGEYKEYILTAYFERDHMRIRPNHKKFENNLRLPNN